MPAESMINKFNKVDFFSVFPSGFYSLTVIILTFSPPSQNQGFLERLSLVVNQVKSEPAWLLFILFGSFLLGSIFRALRVSWAEWVTPPFTSGFPYPALLQKALKNLKDNASASGIEKSQLPDLNKEMNSDIYNFWKDTLCLRNPTSFEYYQSFEAQARFSAGMVWAGLTGILGSVIIIIRSFSLNNWFFWQMLGISFAIYLAFAFHLRRVRKQETRVLLFLYIAYLQNPRKLDG